MLDLLKFGISAKNMYGGEFSKLKAELTGVKGALAGINDRANRAGRGLRNIGAGVSAGLSAPLALLGKQSVQLYDIQLRAEKTVAQAILSTGGAAGKTTEDLKGLASALQAATTFGDEDILQNVTAPLLTFTKIQGETFDRAQSSVLDMATLLKMDLKSASILAGKALNEPIKGISALGRSGVQFSDDQKDVIKSLVETGDVAAAQAIILKELETQFKGQAAAAAAAPLGQWRQLSNSIGDVKEQLGAEIVPFLAPLVESVKNGVTWFSQLTPEVKKNIVVFGGLAAAAGPVLMVLGGAAMGVGTLATALTAMGTALLANPMIALIAAIAGGAYLIYRNWSGIRPWLGKQWDAIKTGVSRKWEQIKSTFNEYTSDNLILRHWKNIGTWFSLQWLAVKGSILVSWDAIKELFGSTYSPTTLIYNAWQGIGAWFEALGPSVKAAFVSIWDAIKLEVSEWPDRMIQFGKDIVAGLVSGLLGGKSEVGSAGRNVARGLEKSVRDELDTHSPSRKFMAIGKDVVAGLGLGIADNAQLALSEMEGLAGALVATGQGAVGFLGSIRDGAKSIFSDVLTGAATFKSSLANVLSGLGSSLIGKAVDGLFGAVFPFAQGAAFGGGRVTPFANGGVVSSPTFFGMSGGSTGLMGEAGPEAIMPLSRGSDGKLGVRAQSGGGGGANIEMNFAPQIDARGADQAAVKRLEAELLTLHQQFETRVYQALRVGRNRNMSVMRG